MKDKSSDNKDARLDPATTNDEVNSDSIPDQQDDSNINGSSDEPNIDNRNLTQENAELVSHLQKLQAEFDNYRKREEGTRSRLLDMAKESVLVEILPILDNVDRAVHSVPEDIKSNSWVQGIEFIATQITQAMNQVGIERFSSLGEVFDPQKHEAIEEIESNQISGTVVKEISTGYKIGDRVVRPATVVVAKNGNQEDLEV